MIGGKCLGGVAMMGGKSIVREAFKYLLSVILRDFCEQVAAVPGFKITDELKRGCKYTSQASSIDEGRCE